VPGARLDSAPAVIVRRTSRRSDVLRLVLSSGLSLVGIGVAGGLLVAFVTTRYLGTLVFGVSPVDPPTFAAAAALLTVVALAAADQLFETG
jgi:ABC-type antimicrobial peptide transport system permease subunit